MVLLFFHATRCHHDVKLSQQHLKGSNHGTGPSAWTLYHRIATGLESGPTGIAPIKARGLAALHLYRETLELVKPVMQNAALEVAEQVLRVVREAAERLPFTREEQQWLNKWI